MCGTLCFLFEVDIAATWSCLSICVVIWPQLATKYRGATHFSPLPQQDEEESQGKKGKTRELG